MASVPSVLAAVEPLISLMYVSSAARLFSEKDILEILRVSRINNERLGITGMLLYHEGSFLQILEGPKFEVSKKADEIELDSRHRGMLRLVTKAEEVRQFPGWSMGFCNLNEIPEEDRAAFSPYLISSVLDEKFLKEPAACYRLLCAFKKTLRLYAGAE